MVLKLNFGGLPLEQVSKMKFIHLKQPFEIYARGSFRDHTSPQRHPKTQAYIAKLDTKLCQGLLISKKMT